MLNEQRGLVFGAPKDNPGGGVVEKPIVLSQTLKNVRLDNGFPHEMPSVTLTRWKKVDINNFSVEQLGNFRQQIDNAKQTLEAMVSDDPDLSNDDKRAITGGLNIKDAFIPDLEALLKKIDAVLYLNNAKNQKEQEGIVGRNTFEKFLIAEGFPKEKLYEATPEAYELKRTFFYTYLFKMVIRQDGNWTQRKFPDPNNVQINLGEQTVSAAQISQTVAQSVSPAEKGIADTVQEKFRLEFGALAVIFSGFADYRKHAFGANEFLEHFDIQKRPETPTYFDDWFFQTLDSLPVLEGDTVPLGQRILIAFQQIIRTGRVLSNGNNSIDGVEYTLVEPTAIDKRNEAARVFSKNGPKEGVWKKLRSFLAKVDPRGKGTGVFPVEVTTDQGLYARVNALKCFASGDGASQPSVSTLGGEAGAAMAMLLAETSLEAMSEDNISGRPLGVQFASRLMHAWEYAYKVLGGAGGRSGFGQQEDEFSSAEGNTNQFIVGRVNKFFLNFFEMFCYDGKTILQHLLQAKRWSLNPAKPADGGIDFSKIPKDLTVKWHNHISRGVFLYNLANGGLSTGDLTGVAKLNLEEGKVTINRKTVAELLTIFRTLMTYHIETDNSAAGASLQEDAEKLSEDFYTITVIDDSTGNKKSMKTRLCLLYPIAAQTDLASWAQNTKVGEVKYIDSINPTTHKKTTGIEIHIKDNIEANEPKTLIARELVARYLQMITLPTDSARRLDKSDYLPLGFFFSSQIREKFLGGGLRGPKEYVLAKLSDAFGVKFFKPEDFGVIGPNLYTEEQFRVVLASVGMRVSGDDFKGFGSKLSKLFST